MCTDEEAKNLERTFYKYYYRRKIDNKDTATLDKLALAGLIEWVSENNEPCAEASSSGKLIGYRDPATI